jgi:protocatechuate 3,4-dioxygenase beta subunit
MPQYQLSRRELIEKCAALGVVVTATSVPISAITRIWDESEVHHATPPNDFGPFYKKHSPQARELRMVGDAGLPLTVTGRILDTRGEALEDATVEVWHADHFGKYDIEGYRFRAHIPLEGKGAYSFDSVMPGHYPARVCQHVHYLVSAPGHKALVTQLYFATDPVFDGDPDKNFTRDPLLISRELVRPVVLTGDPKTIHAAVNFDLCLERL